MEDSMKNQVLVAYATKYGSTAEIAERIGQVLRKEGLGIDIMDVDRANNIAPYKAIVLGSAVYMGRWRKEAAKFLKANEKVLTERPVWLFSSGPTGQGDAIELMHGWSIPKSLKATVERIQPKDITVFHGALELDKLNFFERWIIKKVKAPVGDFRDWNAITSWAAAIANELKEDK